VVGRWLRQGAKVERFWPQPSKSNRSEAEPEAVRPEMAQRQTAAGVRLEYSDSRAAGSPAGEINVALPKWEGWKVGRF
jgi:hypothetical protein